MKLLQLQKFPTSQVHRFELKTIDKHGPDTYYIGKQIISFKDPFCNQCTEAKKVKVITKHNEYQLEIHEIIAFNGYGFASSSPYNLLILNVHTAVIITRSFPYKFNFKISVSLHAPVKHHHYLGHAL